jgi:hypothetical protein
VIGGGEIVGGAVEAGEALFERLLRVLCGSGHER